MSQYQNSSRILLKTSVFYLHFHVSFSLSVLMMTRLKTVTNYKVTNFASISLELPETKNVIVRHITVLGIDMRSEVGPEVR